MFTSDAGTLIARASANLEVELDRDEHMDRRGPETPGFEPPLGNGRYGFFIETPWVQRSDDTDLRRASVACDDDFQGNGPLNSVDERRARVFRFDLFDQARCGYRPAGAVNSTASSTAGSGAESGATSWPYASPASSADAAPGPRTLSTWRSNTHPIVTFGPRSVMATTPIAVAQPRSRMGSARTRHVSSA